MRHTTLLILVAAAALLSACATHAVDKHYGDAWAQMQRAQIYDLRAGGDAPVVGGDPVQQAIALAHMRGDVTDRSAVKPASLITITGGGGQ